ncbi:class I SAM-dependent methyltransferase [Maribellus sp. YY47]|uniref:class I SAM-dependent methyltransferase n=1 Tax=Maribellus sp. YY47 TaxID=2929486 RepID=UPI0020018211|nr:class I SAM-dependent methyltransferase [Maribellus sp. YY47]MCK3683407.1 methyltransferase domain-containing protein [Maribellus sp. YY47]
MIEHNEINFQQFNTSASPRELAPSIRFLIRTIRFLKPGETAYKLEFYERFLNYLRVIGLTALVNNQDSLDKLNAKAPTFSHSFQEFLLHFGIIKQQNGRWIKNPKYIHFGENQLIALMEENKNPVNVNLTPGEQRLVDDFLFVRDLIKKYRQPDTDFKHIKKHGKTWEKLLKTNKLDYEIRLSETLFHLWKFQSESKIRSPFDEAYYTESGRSAFRNFTQPLFQKYIQKLADSIQPVKVFDLGCGYGNYVELVRETLPHSKVTGVEINPEVYKITRDKFADDPNVEIVNTDFFELQSGAKYDFVLMNYVLFYFSREDQKRVPEKAASLLNEGGSIILCQYFSGIESLKEQLAEKQKEWTFFKKIVMHYSDKILYANTLWNDCVDTFSSAVQWDLFLKDLQESELYIRSMTHADPYYYSLFVEIKKLS